MHPLPTQDLTHMLEHSRGLWDDLRGARVFVSGGTGWFGKWLVAAFCHAADALALDTELVVLTRYPARIQAEIPALYQHRAVKLHAGDVESFAFPAGAFSHIIHAATVNDPFKAPIPRDVMFDANVAGTRHVLELAAHARAQRLLHVSSGAVYGPQPLDVMHITEDSLVAPDPARVDLAYGHSKRASEFLVNAHAQKHGYQACHARCYAFVGAYLPLYINFAIGNFIGDALKGGPIRINSDGTPLRSYLYMADLAVWLWTLLVRGQAARAYNVGSDQGISIAELARLVARVVNPDVDVMVARTPMPGLPPARYLPSIERARTELGLQPWVALPDAIERTASWYRGLGC